MGKILIVAQHAGGKLNAGTAKAVSCAQKIGGDIEVAVFATDGSAVAAEAAKVAGVKTVLQVDNPANDHNLAAVVAPPGKDCGRTFPARRRRASWDCRKPGAWQRRPPPAGR